MDVYVLTRSEDHKDWEVIGVYPALELAQAAHVPTVPARDTPQSRILWPWYSWEWKPRFEARLPRSDAGLEWYWDGPCETARINAVDMEING